MMKPSIRMYGGVHHDPGTRQQFLAELMKQRTAPHFVAIEWERSVFARFAACRRVVAEHLSSRWDFLTAEDCHELSLALAWEGDTYARCFPGADVLWLQDGFQEAEIERQGVTATPESHAKTLLRTLTNPCYPTIAEQLNNIIPPMPRSKRELINRVWHIRWGGKSRESVDFEWESQGGESVDFDQDTPWAARISKRSTGLHDGWIAVVVGWAHVKPHGDSRQLRSLLASQGFPVTPVYLGPSAAG